LLIHGFTGSPPELLPLGEYLANQGYAVMAPLLAGHGTCVEDLNRTGWKDWLRSALTGLEQLRTEPINRIYIIGLSMGGLLGLMLAAQSETWVVRKGNGPVVPVVGVATINSPVFMKSPKARFSSWLKWLIPYSPKEFEAVSKEDADALRFAYSQFPVAGVASLMQLIREVRLQLSRVQVPALIVQSYGDETVRPESGEYIYNNLSSLNKRLLWLKQAPHLYTLSLDREIVHKAILELIRTDQV
jgi:carboxylesterase